MKRQTATIYVATGLMIVLASAATAQGGPPPPWMGGGRPPMMGGPEGGMRGPGHGPGRDMAVGIVKSVNASAGTVTIVGPMGERRKIHVDGDTAIHAETRVPVSQLKVGEKVQIMGPIEDVTVASIIVGDLRDILWPPPGREMNRNEMGGPMGRRPVPPHGPASGTISSLDPFTIAMGNISIGLTVDKSAKVGKIVKESIGDIKAGDMVMAAMDPEDEGVATRIAVNFKPPHPPRPDSDRGDRGFGNMGGPGGPPPPDGQFGGPPPPMDNGAPDGQDEPGQQ